MSEVTTPVRKKEAVQWEAGSKESTPPGEITLTLDASHHASSTPPEEVKRMEPATKATSLRTADRSAGRRMRTGGASSSSPLTTANSFGMLRKRARHGRQAREKRVRHRADDREERMKHMSDINGTGAFLTAGESGAREISCVAMKGTGVAQGRANGAHERQQQNARTEALVEGCEPAARAAARLSRLRIASGCCESERGMGGKRGRRE